MKKLFLAVSGLMVFISSSYADSKDINQAFAYNNVVNSSAELKIKNLNENTYQKDPFSDLNGGLGIVLEKAEIRGFNKNWDRLRLGFKLDSVNKKLEKYWESKYLADPDSLRHLLEMSNLYLDHILVLLENKNLPTELALLPFIESGYNSNALSKSKAAGLWQFTRGTGKYKNLERNSYVDERLNFSDSTIAALDYLEELYSLNENNWSLALASYNWGIGNIKKAQKKSKSKKYEKLALPKETKNYIPKLLALRNIISNDKHFNDLELDLLINPELKEVELKSDLNKDEIVEISGVNYEELKKINSGFNLQKIKSGSKIMLPLHSAEALEIYQDLYNK